MSERVPVRILIALLAKLKLYGFGRCAGPIPKLPRVLEKRDAMRLVGRQRRAIASLFPPELSASPLS